ALAAFSFRRSSGVRGSTPARSPPASSRWRSSPPLRRFSFRPWSHLEASGARARLRRPSQTEWPMAGKAYLIGARAGDPRLITLRGVEALGESDFVLVDDLVNDELLRHAKSGARIVRVGKRCRSPRSIRQDVTTRLLVSSVRRGAIVARLK